MAPGSPLAPTCSGLLRSQLPGKEVHGISTKPVLAPSAPTLNADTLEHFVTPLVYSLLQRLGVGGAALTVIRISEQVVGGVPLEPMRYCRVYGYENVDKKKVLDPTRSLFDGGSCASLVAVLAVMLHWQNGSLDFGANVNSYLPARLAIPANGFAAHITIGQLLTHTSGLAQSGPSDLSGSLKKGHSEASGNHLARPSQQAGSTATTALLKDCPPIRAAPPGCVYGDSEANFLLLGVALECVTGQTYSACAVDQVLQPLGMKATAAAAVVAPGVAATRYAVIGGVRKQLLAVGEELTPIGGLLTTPEDMGRLLLACLQGYTQQQDSQKDLLLSDAAIRAMQSAHFGTTEEEVAYGFVRRPLNGRGPPVLFVPAREGLDGADSLCCLLPEAGLGIWIACNTSTDAETSFCEEVLDFLLEKFFPPTLPAAQGPATWLQVLPPARHDSVVSLFTFPYLASSASSLYQPWSAALPNFIQVYGVNLPGRGSRSGEPPLTSIRQLAHAAGKAILELLHDVRPYALLGHGCGALIAYEVARFLAKQGLPAPCFLFLSGRSFPEAGQTVLSGATKHQKGLHTLPDATLLATLTTSEVLPQQYKEKYLMLRALLPILRADITAEETYEHSTTRHPASSARGGTTPRDSPREHEGRGRGTPSKGTSPRDSPRLQSESKELTCPVCVLAGMQDDSVDTTELDSWHQVTSGACTVHRVPGGHYYVDEAVGRKAAVRIVARALGSSLSSQCSWIRQLA